MARILVVDDEWLTRLQVEEMLTHLGYEVAGLAESGRQAFEMARDFRPDLILMDIVMPGEMNGIAAAEKIKAEYNIPIVFISGYGDPEYIEEAKLTEPFGYVMKPFDEKEVRAFIEIALHKKKIENKLQKSEDRYRELVEGTDDIVVRTNRTGVLTYVNKSAEKNFGTNPEKLIGKSALDLVYSKDRKQTEKIIEKSIRSQKSGITLENRIFNSFTGELCHIAWTMNAHYDEDLSFTGLSGIGKDLSAQKILEKAAFDAVKIEAVAVLAGGIAHDFSNIMATILGNIGLAKMDLNAESRAYKELLKAEKASIQTKELISRLMVFSENEAPIKELSSMADLLNSQVGSHQKGAVLDCKVSIPDNISPVKINLTQMKHVIHNVIANAQRATDKKGPISISCENVDVVKSNIPGLKDGRFVKISITDQGSGMSEPTLSKAFDPYFTTQEMGNVKGLGLGLSECDSIVNNHGGRINITSQLGRGTTVFIYLPAIKAEHQALTAAVKPTPLFTKTDGIKAPATAQKVLLVEDTEILRDVAFSIISRLGYKVGVASEGVEAIEVYRREMETGTPFDTVILNLDNNAGMGGIETAERLLVIDPAVKAIICSDQSNNPAMRNFREHGFRAALIKPFTFDELKTAFSEAASE